MRRFEDGDCGGGDAPSTWFYPASTPVLRRKLADLRRFRAGFAPVSREPPVRSVCQLAYPPRPSVRPSIRPSVHPSVRPSLSVNARSWPIRDSAQLCVIRTLRRHSHRALQVAGPNTSSGWCRRGWVSIPVCKCNIFQYPRLPTPAARAPWTGAANRLEQYNDGRAVVVLLKTIVKSEQALPRNRNRFFWKSRSWWQYDASPTT